ncbi:MAG: VOC family protein [Actinobacteria bacterium]|nr:VOC family protein [Actinomycetota bacterium]
MASKIVHWEIIGPDGDAMKAFYGDLFGWEFESPEGFGGYHLVGDDQSSIGGAVGAGSDEMPSYVTLYLSVPDIDAHLARIEAAGGSIVMPRTTIPGMVTYATFRDPAGNLVGLVEGE